MFDELRAKEKVKTGCPEDIQTCLFTMFTGDKINSKDLKGQFTQTKNTGKDIWKNAYNKTDFAPH